jgi:hypothetical protein
MSVTSAPASGRRGRRGTLPVAAVSLLVILAAIGGLLLGGSFGGGNTPAVSPAPAPQPIAHNGLRLQLPRAWTRADVATVPGFARPLGLRNTDAGLRASVERLPAASATLLPAAFLQALKSAPDRPELVTLAGGRRAWRYRFPGHDGSMTFLYAAPTTSGIATVACTSPIDTSVPRACQALAAAVSVPGSHPLEPSTSAAFFSRLPATVADLDTARTKSIGDLGASTHATGQALAADALARAHKSAGAVLGPLTTNGESLPTATVGALSAAATAYTELASAARARSPKLYADASRAVTGADADLRRTMTKVAAAASAATLTATKAPSTPAARTPVATAKPVATAQPVATAKPAATATPVATATPAATATPVATAKPVARTKPAATKKPASKHAAPKHAASKPSVAKSLTAVTPVASAPQGIDLTLIILALVGVIAIVFAVRASLRQLR